MRVEVKHMTEALASYIEATYHLSNPKLVEPRRNLLADGGIAQEPFVESTRSYLGGRRYESLASDGSLRAFFTRLAGDEASRLIFDPPYAH